MTAIENRLSAGELVESKQRTVTALEPQLLTLHHVTPEPYPETWTLPGKKSSPAKFTV